MIMMELYSNLVVSPTLTSEEKIEITIKSSFPSAITLHSFPSFASVRYAKAHRM